MSDDVTGFLVPREDRSPVFREPWEAQAFAMTLALHQRGLFTWHEWTRALAAELRASDHGGELDPANGYYRHWLNALEMLVAANGASSIDELNRHQRAWNRAAHRTPHGLAIELEPQDLD